MVSMLSAFDLVKRSVSGNDVLSSFLVDLSLSRVYCEKRADVMHFCLASFLSLSF